MTVISNQFPERFEFGGLGHRTCQILICDYLWGFLKVDVYRNNQHMLKELKGVITDAVKHVTDETLAAVMETHSHQQMVLDAQGSLQNMFYSDKKLPVVTFTVTPVKYINN
jgi:hypothetical protein